MFEKSNLSDNKRLQICDNPVDEAIQLAEEIAFQSAPVAVKACLETLRQRQNVGLEVRCHFLYYRILIN